MPRRQRVGFALVGTGQMAQSHAWVISKIKGAILVAVYSNSMERAKKIASRYGAKAYRNYKEMLSNPEIQVVDIVTKNNLHAELGIVAAQKGKHVIVEKPIDVSLKKAMKLIKECKKAGVKITVISQQRFDKAFRKVKKMIDNGRFGKIFLAHLSVKWRRTDDYYMSSSGWRASKAECGGGVLILQAIHLLDVLRWLLGPISSVMGKTKTATHKISVEDVAVAILNFKSGVIATIDASTSAKCNLPDRIEIHGDCGSVVIEGNRIVGWYFNKNPIISKAKSVAFSLKSYKKGTIKEQIEDFLKALNEKKEPAVTGLNGLETLKMINSLYHSSKSGKEERV